MADQEGNSSENSGAKGRDERWERDLLERLAFASLNEQRRARRWTIFFRFVLVFFLVTLLFLSQTLQLGEKPLTGRYTALVDIEGIIAADTLSSADNVISGLRAAFESKTTAGVIVRTNSPGGSPVQAGYINDEIRRLRELYPKTPVYAVIGDVCASGCYYVAAATDRIYANKASIVGSIGVLMDGFGFVKTLKKLGIERRLLTAGKDKGFLDPFSPLKPSDRKHAQELLNQVHRQFIEVVREGRGDTLGKDKNIFSGLFWTGEKAMELGLVDELASAGQVARDIIGAEDIVDYTYRENLFDRFARRIGTAVAETLGLQLFYTGKGLK